MSGTFVISLDFELMWGVRDHRSVGDYGDAILGGRVAVPEILSRFKSAGIRATWATVGLLFAKSRGEMLEFAPDVRPNYADPRLSPYPAIESGSIGENEQDDPLHFGGSLIDRIADTPGQEIATHTYSHFYCLEPGQDMDSFSADIDAAITIANARGLTLTSLVFPRNQKTPAHARRAAELGIEVTRGERNGWLYRPRSGAQKTPLFRVVRFLDDALPTGLAKSEISTTVGPAIDVPSSRFLRPWSKKFGPYNALHIRRIQSEMKLAAQSGGTFHLWWHPHNFGRHPKENLARLDELLDTFRYCSDSYGMTSSNMRDFAFRANSVNSN